MPHIHKVTLGGDAMDILIFLGAILAMCALGAVAMRFGADSRPGFDERSRNWA